MIKLLLGKTPFIYTLALLCAAVVSRFIFIDMHVQAQDLKIAKLEEKAEQFADMKVDVAVIRTHVEFIKERLEKKNAIK